MSNPLKTHTDNLKDGAFIFSSSLTNMLEGVHGNGILLLEDYAVGESRRVTPSALPGAIAYASANTVTIKGGHGVLDGVVVDFAGGYSSNTPNTLTLDLDSSSYGSALTTGQQCLFVIYVTTDNSSGVNRIGVERSSAGTSFPNIPTAFLNEGGSLDVDQTFVLGVVKAIYADNSTTMKINVVSNSNIYDLRSFVRPSPLYLGRMSKGAVGATATDSIRINSHADLDGIHGGGTENGTFSASKLGGLWMGADEGNNDVLFFSGYQSSTRRTHRLGPNLVLTQGSSANVTFQFDDYNYFILTPTGNITLTADTSDSAFPPGHTIFVSNKHATNTVTFGSFTINGNTSGVFVYDGSAWQQAMRSSTSSSTSSGVSGLVQLSDGSSGFTSDSTISFNTSSNKLTVTGDVSITNLLSDAKAVEFTPHGSNLGGTAGQTLWMDSGDSNKLKLGSDTVLTSGNTTSASYNFVGLTDTPANFNSASNKFLQVNNGNGTNGTAVEFGTIVEGDLPTTLPSVTSIGANGNTLTAAGNVLITGTLEVSGGTTTISSTTITVDDKNIELGSVGSPSDSTANGGGITLKGANDKTISWSSTTGAWEFNKGVFPSSDSALDLGSSAIRWANGYFDTVYGAGNFTTITGSGNVAIDTDTLKVDVTNDRVGINQATPLAPLQIANVGYGESTGSINDTLNDGSGADSKINITLFPTANFRSGKLLIEFDGEDTINGGGNRVFETAEAVVTHDGTNAAITVYGLVQSNSNETLQGVYDTKIDSGNLILEVTPQITGIVCDVRVSWQAMVA